MGISIVNCKTGADFASSWALLRDGQIYPVEGRYASHREIMASYFSDPQQLKAAVAAKPLDNFSGGFNSPITADVQLFCQGLNYADHREESGKASDDPGENLVFLKAASSICAPNETILRPKDCRLLDYEIELGLVLRKPVTEAVQITNAELPNYIGGLVLTNDVSARDLMFGAPMLQWFRGKSQRTFCPMGPVLYLLDSDDFQHLFDLDLVLKMNGVIKQSASTGSLIHRPAETLSDISAYANMDIGDCILTGTPGGVLAGASLKTSLAVLLNFKNDEKRRRKFTEAQLAQTRFLEPGDELELSIKSRDGSIDLGCQRNAIAEA